MSIIAEISGVITDINYTNKYFEVYTKKNKSYIINYGERFLPVELDDLFYGRVSFKDNNTQSTELNLITDPFVILPTDSDSLINLFVKSKSFINKSKAESLYSILQLKNPNVSDYLDTLSSEYNKYRNNNSLDSLKPTLSEKSAEIFVKFWYKRRVLRQLYLLGLNNREIKNSRISELQTYKTLLENPYKVSSISIEKSDNILIRQNKNIDVNIRNTAIIFREFQKMCESRNYINIPNWMILKIWPNFAQMYPVLNREYSIIGDLECIYTRYNYDVECLVANVICNLLKTEKYTNFTNLQFTDSNLTTDQKESVIHALNNNISIITGAGGTGKTTVIREIVNQLQLKECKFEVCSFTGKAVSRLREVLGSNFPLTLDRLIAKFKDNMFEYLIIDEISMVCVELIYRLFITFTHKFRLILVGDINQLEPTGVGAFLDQLLKTNLISVYTLTTNHRVISCKNNINLILSNTLGMINTEPDDPEPFEFIPGSEFQMIDNSDIRVVSVILNSLKNAGISEDDIIILTPFNKHCVNLNKIFQSVYNKNVNNDSFTIDSNRRILYVGDRVTHNYNDYSNNIVNGESGKIIECKPEYVRVQFSDSKIFKFNTVIKVRDDLNEFESENKSENKAESKENKNDSENKAESDVGSLDVSYSITVHKSQGSEWKYVIHYIPTDSLNDSFLDKRFIYTAFSRAKIAEFVIGDITAINVCIRKPLKQKYDKLADRIITLNNN
jgi:hypothetical protein